MSMRCVFSFPKSGRTWLRHIMAQYGLDRDVTVKDMVGVKYNGKLVSFRHFIRVSRRFRIPRDKMLWLHRNELDTFNSYYWHVTHRSKEMVGQSPLKVASLALPKIVDFNTYWKTLAENNKVLEITYEDMFNIDAVHDVLVEFMGCCKIDLLRDAYSRSSFVNMRAKEAAAPLADDILGCVNLDDVHAYKMRRGKIGSFREDLSEYADVIDELWTTISAGEVKDKAVKRAMRDLSTL